MAERVHAYHHGDLRTALVEEAAAMISDDGAASVTMRAIGGRLGVSRAAPYRHFPDKTALLVAVAVQGFERLRLRLESLAATDSPASVDRLLRMGEEYVRFALEHPAHYRLMWGKEAIARQNEPELREAAGALLEHLVDAIGSHQRSGEMPPGDARARAYVAWSAVHGLASLLIEGQIDPNVDVDGLIRQTTETLLAGLRASKTPP